ERIANEEHRRVVADQVPVAFLSVELDGEAAHVALGVSSTHLTGNGGETQQQRRLGARLEGLRLGVLGNVARDLHRAVGTPALGMHGTLGDALTVLVSKLFDELIILQQDWPALTGGQGVLVIRNRSTSGSRHRRFISHTLQPHCQSLRRGRAAAGITRSFGTVLNLATFIDNFQLHLLFASISYNYHATDA